MSEIRIINRIGILLSWPRELDMYQALIENIPSDLVIVIDDFIYTESERSGNVKNIVGLVDGKLEYVLLSKIFGKLKYNILFSTAQTFQERFTFSSYFKYYYAVSIGRLLLFSRLSNLFLKIMKRPLTGGGAQAKKFERHQIERKIGVKIIRSPKGLDVSRLVYPAQRWDGIFDMHLCHGNIDKDLILNKFVDANCVKIGYPKYDNSPSTKFSKKTIIDEFKSIDSSKPLLLWMPTHVKFKSESLDNINLWSPIVRQILDKYNVLVRPHPKSIAVNPKIVNNLQGLGFTVDVKRNRELKTLYQAADLVLADYGGSVLSAIYMRKKLILLNMPDSSEFARWRKDGMYVDNSVRNNVDAFYDNNGTALIKKIEEEIMSNDVKINSLRIKYFGDEEDCDNIADILQKLIKELRG